MSTWLSPDCAAGKCRACTGEAWNHDNDYLTYCGCRCHEGGSEDA